MGTSIIAHPESFVATLTRLAGSSTGLFRKPTDVFAAWLQKKRIPAWLRQHLIRYALAHDMEVGVIRLYSPSSLRASNDQSPIMVRRGFLQIGSATNGDPVAVRFRGEKVVGYLMGTSALYMVAGYRAVESASVLVVGDSIVGSAWSPHFDEPAIRTTLDRIGRELLAFLSKSVSL